MSVEDEPKIEGATAFEQSVAEHTNKWAKVGADNGRDGTPSQEDMYHGESDAISEMATEGSALVDEAKRTEDDEKALELFTKGRQKFLESVRLAHESQESGNPDWE